MEARREEEALLIEESPLHLHLDMKCEPRWRARGKIIAGERKQGREKVGERSSRVAGVRKTLCAAF